MPSYDYYCLPNKQEFEVFHSITTELQECPVCQEKNLEQHKPTRLISRTSFILQGGGWAKDNYSSK